MDRLKFRLYKLTLAKYEQKLTKQDNKCSICGIEFAIGKAKPQIDHDHKCCSGKESCGECVRDILCYNCNAGLGNFRDNIEAMQKAVQYIIKYSECRELRKIFK